MSPGQEKYEARKRERMTARTRHEQAPGLRDDEAEEMVMDAMIALTGIADSLHRIADALDLGRAGR